MRSLIAWLLRSLRSVLFNTPIRNWRLTEYFHNRVSAYLIGSKPYQIIPFDGATFKVSSLDTSVAAGLINNHYETYTLAVFQQILESKVAASSGPVVFADVGANIGIFTVLAAVKNPNIEVHSFEPNHASFSLLSENIRLNSLTNVTAINSGVSDRSGTASLDISSRCAGMHSLSGSGPNRLQIALLSLDDFYAHKNPPQVVKIDVEGHEPEVLLGMTRMLKDPNLVIILEFNPKNLLRAEKEPQAFLRKIMTIFNEVYCLDEVAHQSYRFVSEDRRLARKILSTGFNLMLKGSKLGA